MTRSAAVVCRFAVALALVAMLGACSAPTSRPALSRDRDPLIQNRDSTQSPGQDFFKYANGGWLKRNPIPPTERGWGIGYVVREQNYKQLLEICETAARTTSAPGTSEQLVGDLWASGMDSTAVEAQGVAPLQPYLSEIAAISDRTALLRTIARYQTLGLAPLYGLWIGQDEKNSDKYIVHLAQGGLTLPDRDYYFAGDSNTRRVRAEYSKHLAAMFGLLGETADRAKRSAADVVKIETALARRSRTIEQRRDPWANYNKRSVAQLTAANPGLDWPAQLAGMGFTGVDSVVVAQPEFLVQADSLVTATSLDAWKSYLRWTVVTSLANRLGRAFDAENFHFFATVMNGVQEMRPRWKRVLDTEENGIGELMGQVWVKRYCSPATKARYEKLTADIIDAYRDRIRTLPWMTEATKQRALGKLDHVTRKVAYPDHWRDYSALKIDRGSYATNQIRINEWWFRHEANKLGKPIDRTEWDMTPQTYNAYYDGSKVEIVLPAAVFMIPGLPDSLVDDAILYSYAGAGTIGHEITHGFDDEGRQSDERGNLNPWWTDQDSVQFTQRAKKLVDQFDHYQVGDLHVRGQATLGENLADLGGVVLGYEAFKRTDEWKRHQVVNGLTPDQRYFMGYALGWLGQRRPEANAQLIMSDVHSPEYLRVNGPLANVPEFYAAFGVKPGDPMWRADSVRVTIW